MEEQRYPASVSHLLTLGRPEGFEPSDWGHSVTNGLTPEHVPDLVRMLDDPSLNDPAVDDPKFYGPVHAWRALGHFKAAPAVDTLIRCLQVRQRWEDFDDWSLEEIPQVLCAIGPEAIAPMMHAIMDPTAERYSASAMAEGLAKIAIAYPDQRERVVAHLIEAGERFADLPKETNDGILMALLDLKALESVPLLRRMFHARAVNRDMVGDWSEVRRELNLERQPDDPPERRPGESVHDPDSLIGQLARRLNLEERWKTVQAPAESPPPAPAKHTAKWHRKQAKKHRQQTRRC